MTHNRLVVVPLLCMACFSLCMRQDDRQRPIVVEDSVKSVVSDKQIKSLGRILDHWVAPAQRPATRVRVQEVLGGVVATVILPEHSEGHLILRDFLYLQHRDWPSWGVPGPFQEAGAWKAVRRIEIKWQIRIGNQTARLLRRNNISFGEAESIVRQLPADLYDGNGKRVVPPELEQIVSVDRWTEGSGYSIAVNRGKRDRHGKILYVVRQADRLMIKKSAPWLGR